MNRKKQKERKGNNKINIQRGQTLTKPLDYANHAGFRKRHGKTSAVTLSIDAIFGTTDTLPLPSL
jgi:hypothetical protein